MHGEKHTFFLGEFYTQLLIEIPKMRTALTILIFSLLFIVPAMAQKVTLREKDAPLEDVLQKIKKQTNYDVFYAGIIISKAAPVTINVRNKELLLVLNEIFDAQPISYSIANRTIVLGVKKRENQPITKEEEEMIADHDVADPLVPGRVINQQGEVMAGVTVLNLKDSLNKRGVTDRSGRFSITASRGDLISFRSQGHKESIIMYRGEPSLKVQMFERVYEVEDVTIEAKVKEKLNLNTQIDLSNRGYMNLGQILQGTVPGLTLQILPSNKRKVIGVNVGTRPAGELIITYYTVEQYLQRDPQFGPQVIQAIERGLPPPPGAGTVFPVFSTTSSVTLVPELRGSASFGNTEGMMVVIDGFPVEEFPADYPMANVESVEVIKDPQELIKWGPKATAGIILIKTKGGENQKVSITYSTNMYYKPKPKYSVQDLGLATSADLVDLFKSIADSSAYVTGESYAESTDISTILLNRLYNKTITREQFNRSMDSLALLSNESQIGLLQQNAFSMNHLLNVSGGSTKHRFAVTTSYSNAKSNGLGNNADAYTMDIKNDFNLLQGRLKMKWIMNGGYSKSNEGGSDISVYNLPRPYQLLLGADGGYVYDYTILPVERNALIEQAGYFNHGVNVLEDSRLKNSITRGWHAQTRFDMDWEILKGLKFINSVYYRRLHNKTENITDWRSSEARQTFNRYGSPTANGVDFHVPVGDILRRSSNMQEQLSLRSALLYKKQIGDHLIGVSAGGGLGSDIYEIPSFPTQYGYNQETGYSTPVYIPVNPDGGVRGFRSVYSTETSLERLNYLFTPNMGVKTIRRSMNYNGGLNYVLKDSLIRLDFNYGEILSPNYGMPTYARTQTYSGELNYKFERDWLPTWISNVTLGTGYVKNKLPDIPKPISGSRTLQPDWNTYGIWVNNYLPIQQRGQSSENLFQKVTLNLFNKQLALSATYNTQTMYGIPYSGNLNDTTSTDMKRTLGYLGFKAEGFLRDGNLLFTARYDKSPEGQSQINANLTYDIKHESYFHSEYISSLLVGGTIQNTSSFQGMGLMMGTNAPQGGGFSLATNTNFGLMPPNNRNIEVFAQMGMNNEKTRIDIRYYNRSDIGISNGIPTTPDPSTGLQNEVTYSNIVNRGVEFYIKSEFISKPRFRYSAGLNGAYNQNFAAEVPDPPYRTDNSYLTAYRKGYSTSNVWGYRWAGLDAQGNPQIYDKNGNPTATPDSTTLAEGLVYMGVTRAPWTAGIIQDVTIGDFFGRATLLVNLGGVMKRYIPTPSKSFENSALIRDRWRKPGDEAFTDVPALSNESIGSYRNYLTQNSSNSFFSSNFVRVQELMVGWKAPGDMFSGKYMQSLSVAFHVQNLAFWTQNKYHLDPNTVDNQGRPGLPIPVQYGLTLNTSF